MTSETTFQSLPNDAKDLILSVSYNLYGDRMVTASSDHHLRVWDKRKDNWVLVDSWRAHDAEVTEVRCPFTCAAIASPPST